MSSIKRALISLSDKTGAVEFAQTLTKLGVEILSTGGTAKLLADAGVPVIEVADYTGFPEMLDGRVKTLHPKIHGGILGRRDLDEHVAKMEEHGIGNIDLVCVNLYPFAATIAKPNCTLETRLKTSTSAARPWSLCREKLETRRHRYRHSRFPCHRRRTRSQQRRLERQNPFQPLTQSIQPYRPIRRHDFQLPDLAFRRRLKRPAPNRRIPEPVQPKLD